MKQINDLVSKENRKIKVLQFGEGNFLRAFADYMIDLANLSGVYDGNIAVMQPIDFPLVPYFDDQDCNYTVVLRGMENGEVVDKSHIVTSVFEVFSPYRNFDKFLEYAHSKDIEAIISNTTEAGIVYDKDDRFEYCPPHSYPGKLTKFLYERFVCFNGDASKAPVIFPVELIEANGKKLKECVLRYAEDWNLGSDFKKWIDECCLFCSTLVDRIVTGHIKNDDEREKFFASLGYKDMLIDICEPFGLWVIESSDIERAQRALPLDKAGMPVIFTSDQTPYRERKVRILNGAHTSFVPSAFLMGENIVRDSMKNDVVFGFFTQSVYSEIIPTLKLDKEDLINFADSVGERFSNPFIDHYLLSICLNSFSKWKSRVLPSLLDYVSLNGKLPHCLVFSFAALIKFYSTCSEEDGRYFGRRTVNGNEEKYEIKDDESVLKYFSDFDENASSLKEITSSKMFFSRSLDDIDSFTELCDYYYNLIGRKGIRDAMIEATENSRKETGVS